MNIQNLKNNKRLDFEIMRIIAIFLVIFNHLPGYILYQSSNSNTWIYMFITMITRINVPLFLMLSGALLLGKEENYKILLGKRVKRFIIIIILFGFGLYFENACFEWLVQGNWNFGFLDFTYKLFNGSIENSYWYLYAYLGFLLMLPLLRKICSKLEKNDIIFLLFLHFIFSSLLPLINVGAKIIGIKGISITGNLFIPLATAKQFFYPIVGYYVDTNINVKKLTKRHNVGLVVIALLGIIISCICTYYEGINLKFTENYVQLFDYVTTIVVFILIKEIVERKINVLKTSRISKIIYLVGSLTFGIYLLDPFLKKIVYKNFFELLDPVLPTLILSILWCLFSMICGGIITYILKKIPVIRKLI